MSIRTALTNTAFAAGLALLPALALAQTGKTIIYKWTDEQGVVHFEMSKPADPNQAVETIKKRDDASGEETPAETPAAATNTSAPAAAPTTNAAQASKKDPAVCERARANLEQLQNRRRVTVSDQYGNERQLDEKEQQDEIKRAQDAIKANCP